ncbi:MAG: HlyD family type I secretion periplasmic adaptor subunit [bacterium]
MTNNIKKIFLLSFLFLFIFIAGITGLVLWSWYGKLEESVPGIGRIIPEEHLKQVMSPIDGIVSKVYVRENQKIKSGQALVILDPENAVIDQMGISEQLRLLQEETNAIKSAYSNKKEKISNVQNAWVDATREAYQAQMNLAKMQIDKSLHQYQESLANLNQIRSVLDSNEKLLEQYHALYNEGGLPENELKKFEQQVFNQRGQYMAIQEEVKAKKIELEQAQQQPKAITGNHNKELLGKLSDQQKNIAQLRNEVLKNRLNYKRHIIYAPIGGIINEQIVYGPGETVAAGQTLLSIVPEDSELIAEIKVANKDLSYINLKQRVALSLDAFPYQHFGKLYGVITSISPSSRQDAQNTPPYYLVRVKPDKDFMQDKNGETYPLRSGLTLNADFVTQKNSLISFLVEPVLYHIDRAFRDPTTK